MLYRSRRLTNFFSYVARTLACKIEDARRAAALHQQIGSDAEESQQPTLPNFEADVKPLNSERGIGLYTARHWKGRDGMKLHVSTAYTLLEVRQWWWIDDNDDDDHDDVHAGGGDGNAVLYKSICLPLLRSSETYQWMDSEQGQERTSPTKRRHVITLTVCAILSILEHFYTNSDSTHSCISIGLRKSHPYHALLSLEYLLGLLGCSLADIRDINYAI